MAEFSRCYSPELCDENNSGKCAFSSSQSKAEDQGVSISKNVQQLVLPQIRIYV